VYYGGGNLMLVDGRKLPWALHFDKKYFMDGGSKLPTLPFQFSSIDDAHAWVLAFPELIDGMDKWWKQHRRVSVPTARRWLLLTLGWLVPHQRLSRAGS